MAATVCFVEKIWKLIEAMTSRCISGALRPRGKHEKCIESFLDHLDQRRLYNTGSIAWTHGKQLLAPRSSLKNSKQAKLFLRSQYGDHNKMCWDRLFVWDDDGRNWVSCSVIPHQRHLNHVIENSCRCVFRPLNFGECEMDRKTQRLRTRRFERLC